MVTQKNTIFEWIFSIIVFYLKHVKVTISDAAIMVEVACVIKTCKVELMSGFELQLITTWQNRSIIFIMTWIFFNFREDGR